MGRWGMSADSALMAFEAFSAPEFSITIPPKNSTISQKFFMTNQWLLLQNFYLE